MKKYSIILAGVAASFLCMVAQANTISGSISFSGIASVGGGSTLATDTHFTSIHATVQTGSVDYAAVPNYYDSLTPVVLSSTGTALGGASVLTPGLMSDYTWSPPAGSVTPLWAFTTGGLTYTFDATSMTALYVPAARIWDIAVPAWLTSPAAAPAILGHTGHGMRMLARPAVRSFLARSGGSGRFPDGCSPAARWLCARFAANFRKSVVPSWFSVKAGLDCPAFLFSPVQSVLTLFLSTKQPENCRE